MNYIQEILNQALSELLVESMSLNDIKKKYYADIDDNIFNKIVQADPTYNANKPDKMGKYTKWLLKLYKKGNLPLEDLYKATDYLQKFNEPKVYNKITNKDINKYQSLSELYNTIMQFYDESGNSKVLSQKEKKDLTSKEATKAYEDSHWLIVVPHTQRASIMYGKGTQWCTAAEKSDNRFDDYNELGHLYIIIDKKTGEKYQFHFETQSFMDETDAPIDKGYFWSEVDADGKLKNFFKNEVYDWYNMLYDNIDDFRNGFARVERYGKWSFIDMSGELLKNEKGEEQWFDKVDNFCFGWARVENENGDVSLINEKGKLIENGEIWFEDVGDFFDGFAYVEYETGETSLVNKDGNLIGNGQLWFDDIYAFKDGFAIVEDKNEYSFLNQNGELIGNGEIWVDDLEHMHNSKYSYSFCYNGIQYYTDNKLNVYDTKGNGIGNLTNPSILNKMNIQRQERQTESKHITLMERIVKDILSKVE